jgi:hypothetical protein
VALLSETHLKPHKGFVISTYHIYQTDCFSDRKGGTAIAVRKGILHNRVDFPPLVSVEAIGGCIPTDNSQILLAGVYKCSGLTWIDADITELLSFRH